MQNLARIKFVGTIGNNNTMNFNTTENRVTVFDILSKSIILLVIVSSVSSEMLKFSIIIL